MGRRPKHLTRRQRMMRDVLASFQAQHEAALVWAWRRHQAAVVLQRAVRRWSERRGVFVFV